MAPARRQGAPIDTTGKRALEAKWQALVDGVIEAKAAAAERKQAWSEACVARGPLQTASPEAAAAAEAARAAYDDARSAVEAAQERMKAGDL